MSNDNKLDIILSELRDIKDNVTELKTDVTELKTDVTELKTDVTELKTDVAALKTDVSRLDNKIDGVEAKLTSKMNREFRTLAAKLDLSSTTLDSELVDVKKDIKELRNEMRAVVQY